MVLLKGPNECRRLILSNLEKSANLWCRISTIKVFIWLYMKLFVVFDSELYTSAKNALVLKKYNIENPTYSDCNTKV